MLIGNPLKHATTALVGLLILFGFSPSLHADTAERATLAAMIEDAHAVSDVLKDQIGTMEDFRRNGTGYMLRDTNGALYFLPFSDAQDLASMMALQVWMGNAHGFRGVGGDLGDLPAAIRLAITSNRDGLSTEGELDLEKVNRFVGDFVESALDVYDETNRERLDQQINALHDELNGIAVLIEDAEFELAALDAQETAEETASAETLAVDESSEPDWREIMAQRDAVLPQGVTLIEPVPNMDKQCPDEHLEAPIWILVADASVCTGQWAVKGSGEYNGVTGQRCVWCPADMWWRSGWGCCFPN